MRHHRHHRIRRLRRARLGAQHDAGGRRSLPRHGRFPEAGLPLDRHGGELARGGAGEDRGARVRRRRVHERDARPPRLSRHVRTVHRGEGDVRAHPRRIRTEEAGRGPSCTTSTIPRSRASRSVSPGRAFRSGSRRRRTFAPRGSRRISRARASISSSDPGASRLDLKLLGKISVYNALTAAACAHALGVDVGHIKTGLENVAQVPGRFQVVSIGRGPTAVVDYAHTPDALEKLLNFCRELGPRKIVTVFGCGGDRDRGKRPMMGGIAARLSNIVFVTDDNPRTEDPDRIVKEILDGVGESGVPRPRRQGPALRDPRGRRGRRGRRPRRHRRKRPRERTDLPGRARSVQRRARGRRGASRPGGGPSGLNCDGLRTLSPPRDTAEEIRAPARYEGVSIDTREDCEARLFVALKGALADGHDYLDAAIGKGAAALLVSSGRKAEAARIAGDDSRFRRGGHARGPSGPRRGVSRARESARDRRHGEHAEKRERRISSPRSSRSVSAFTRRRGI